MQRWRILGVAIVFVIAAMAVRWLWINVQIDRCLDHGRRWSYEVAVRAGST